MNISFRPAPREVRMPAYKYICNECHTRFELIPGIKELDQKEDAPPGFAEDEP